MTDTATSAIAAPLTSRPQRLFTVLRALAAIVVVVILANKLSDIGWAKTWAALPTHPMFYMLFGLIYVLMPFVDLAIYKNFWDVQRWALPAFFRKRVFNELVFDYSGEVFLFVWAKNHIQRTTAQLASTIKDVNLLSGATSNGVTLLLLIGVGLTDQTVLLLPDGADAFQYLLVPVGIVLAVSLGVLIFRNKLFALSQFQAQRVFSLHFLRLILTLALMATQWWVALPQVSFATWAAILTMRMLLTRLPFLPNQDVMFMWVAVSLAGAIDAPEEAVTSMFVTAGALALVTHAFVFAVTALIPDRRALHKT